MMKNKIKVIFELFIFLAIIQVIRVVLLQMLLKINTEAINFHSLILIVVGALLILLFKPSRRELGLDMGELRTRGKRIYIGLTVVVLLLAIFSPSNYTGNYQDLFATVEAAIIFPVFEELLFRGVVWNKLEQHRLVGVQIYAVTTILFGIWHLGYSDVIFIRASQYFTDANMTRVMAYKVLVGALYGALTGFVRLRTKNTYSSILLHSVLNIFGR